MMRDRLWFSEGDRLTSAINRYNNGASVLGHKDYLDVLRAIYAIDLPA